MSINFRQHSVTLDDDNSARVPATGQGAGINNVEVDQDVD